MTYHDRVQAGGLLAYSLERLRDHPVVLAIPRGGVIVAAVVAAHLGAPLDVIVPRKLRAPYQPELAIGAVAGDGIVYLDAPLAEAAGADREYIDEEVRLQVAEIARRTLAYRGDRPPLALRDRTVIVVDDGIATGATMIAALRSIRREDPARLVAAIPVASVEGAERLRREADEVVTLQTPEPFYAVGQYYEDFSQTSDDEVVALLEHAWAHQPAG